MKINMNIQKAIELALSQVYYSEFQVIDGLNQHPRGENFYDFLLSHGIIDQKERARIDVELEKEALEDEALAEEHMAHVNQFS